MCVYVGVDVFMIVHAYIYIYICIYTHIYIERERDARVYAHVAEAQCIYNPANGLRSKHIQQFITSSYVDLGEGF